MCMWSKWGRGHLYACEQVQSQMNLGHVRYGGDLVGNKWWYLKENVVTYDKVFAHRFHFPNLTHKEKGFLWKGRCMSIMFVWSEWGGGHLYSCEQVQTQMDLGHVKLVGFNSAKVQEGGWIDLLKLSRRNSV